MDQWKNILVFNRAERRGIWILTVLILTGSALNTYLRNNKRDTSRLQIEVMLAASQTGTGWSGSNYRNKNAEGKGTKKGDSLFFFDPNTLTPKAWQQLGLSEKQSAVITGYISKGGRFRRKEDLKRSFVISERFYAKIEPWIKIDETQFGGSDKIHERMKQEKSIKNPVHLNNADSAELTGLRGIGTVLAKRIILYRNALGGFHSTQQLEEVYGLAPDVVMRNIETMVIGSNEIRLMNVNQTPQNTLTAHPYISKRLAYMIAAIRKESRILSRDDLIARLPDGTEINPNLWPYFEY